MAIATIVILPTSPSEAVRTLYPQRRVRRSSANVARPVVTRLDAFEAIPSLILVLEPLQRHPRITVVLQHLSTASSVTDATQFGQEACQAGHGPE